MKKLLVLIIFIWFNQMAFNQSINEFDLVIYGGTSAGVSATVIEIPGPADPEELLPWTVEILSDKR